MCVCPSFRQAGPAPAKIPRKLSATAISYYSSGLQKGRETQEGWWWGGTVPPLPLPHGLFCRWSAVAGEIRAVISECRKILGGRNPADMRH